MNIIEEMLNSGIESLVQRADTIQKWSKLRKTKKDLELLLNFNIAEIKFITADGREETMICTSNTALVSVLKATTPETKEALAKKMSRGMRTRKSDSVMTYDLIGKRIKTINLKYKGIVSWQLMPNFITISKENILEIDRVLNGTMKAKPNAQL